MPDENVNQCCEQEARPTVHGLLSAPEPCDCDAPTPIGRMHNISIHSLDYGYNVKIGCQNFAVETVDKLIKNLEAYLKDPQGTEKKWMSNKELL